MEKLSDSIFESLTDEKLSNLIPKEIGDASNHPKKIVKCTRCHRQNVRKKYKKCYMCSSDYICLSCLVKCSKCTKYGCNTCKSVNKCNTCDKPYCVECMSIWGEEGARCIKCENLYYCDGCLDKERVCEECLASEEETLIKCPDCEWSTTSLGGGLLCYVCSKDDFDYFCRSCLNKCEGCGVYGCRGCSSVNECDICNGVYCRECMYRKGDGGGCKKCNRVYYCDDCLENGLCMECRGVESDM